MIKKAINIWRKGKSYNNSEVSVKSFPSIRIEPTNVCMMNCKMCPRKHMKRKVGFMDLGLFEKIVSQLKFKGDKVTLHHFGDPLLHPKIGEMIRILHKYGLRANFSTNPVTLTEKNIDAILDNNLDAIHISLDGATKETLEKIRGKNANYEKSIERLNDFLREKLRRGKKTEVTVSIINMKETKEEIEDFKKKWSVKGVDKILVKPFIQWDGSIDEINKLAEDSQLAKSHRNKQDYTCFWPWSRLVVLWDGRVVPCCYDYDAKVVLGDLNKQTLKEVWNSKEMQNFRKLNLNKFPKNHLCEKCHEKEGSKKSRIFPVNLILKKGFKVLDYFKYN